MALLIALALMPALQAGACTDQSPYDYGDATADGAVNVQDKSRIDAILGASQPASSTSDATADGATNVQDKSRVDAILGASQTPTDRYVAVYDFSSGAGTTHLGAYKQAAELAGERDPKNLPRLIELLEPCNCRVVDVRET